MTASNATQSHNLFQLLKSGETVSKDKIASTLGIKIMSVPVYIFSLKKQFKAEIVAIRNGKKVTGYKLANSEDITVPQLRKNSAVFEKPKKIKNVAKSETPAEVVKTMINEDGSVPTLEPDAEVTKFSEKEYSDLADSLGIGFGGSDRIFE